MFFFSPASQRHSRLRLRDLAVFLLLSATAPPCIAQVEIPNTASPSSKSPGDKILGPISFGFDLGQSYGTSAARFENGTTIPLAKIRGTNGYAALMETLVAQASTPHWLSYEGTIGRLHGLFQTLKRSLVHVPTEEARVLAEMVAALKTASEATLQTQIKAVAVTAPWVDAWDGQNHDDSVINDALLLAGLEPWKGRWEEARDYLGEANAALASERRWLCQNNWCAGHWVEVEEETTSGGPLFFVSFTNRSLYTSFQRSTCYHFGSEDHHLASIDPRYGLDHANQAESPAKFWSELRLHLTSLAKKNRERDRGDHSQLPLTMLVTGEAAETPEFLDVVRDVARDIEQLCTSEPKAVGCKENTTGGGVELVILDDPTYGPAKGAAFWLWTRMSKGYCAEIGILDQYDMVRDHVEL
ncbi:hypothetical protein B0T16DRAFT_235591 [Cercophora newfieldiana]|uniref:Uncharacterized protein n=1 Tax=Cercophora newfieldiana TaxID=92897 RepID=A0AA40CHG5_9PEZI|nr:hypothetical protein B0T16DRAFT_235591 [Cercophora newfieldiana]